MSVLIILYTFEIVEKMEVSKNITTNKQHFDVVISGGGLSGSLMALSLLPLKTHEGKPLSIAIIEAVNAKHTASWVWNHCTHSGGEQRLSRPAQRPRRPRFALEKALREPQECQAWKARLG